MEAIQDIKLIKSKLKLCSCRRAPVEHTCCFCYEDFCDNCLNGWELNATETDYNYECNDCHVRNQTTNGWHDYNVKKAYERCRNACLTLTMIRKFRLSILSDLDVNIVRHITKLIWINRHSIINPVEIKIEKN